MVKKTLTLIFALIAAIAGCLLLCVSMQQGAGVGGDAVIYITSARNLLAGKGLGLINPAGEFRLIPYFPPFYSLLLAVPGLLGLPSEEIPQAAMIMNVILFGGLIFMLAYWTGKAGDAPAAGLAVGLLTAGSPILIPAYSWAMSEPLANFLGFLGLILFEKYIDRKQKKYLIFSAVSIGFSILTRYSSVAFLITVAVLLLGLRNASWKEKLKNFFSFGITGSFPTICWLVIDYLQTKTISSRTVLGKEQIPALLDSFFKQMKFVFMQWLFPESFIHKYLKRPNLQNFVFGFIFFIVLFCLIFSIFRARKRKFYSERYLNRMMAVLGLFFIVFCVVIMIVSIRTYPPITIGSRMFLPAYIAFVWIIAILFGQILISEDSDNLLKTLFFILIFSYAVFGDLRGIRIARQNRIDGLGYNSQAWKNSETVDFIKNNVAENQTIVTNEETALLFLTQRVTWPMHEVYVTQPDQDFYAYDQGNVPETDYGRKAFQEGKAILVVFDSFEDQMGGIYGDQTTERIDALFKNLDLLYDCDDGKVFSKK